jgi:hypothetical protein
MEIETAAACLSFVAMPQLASVCSSIGRRCLSVLPDIGEETTAAHIDELPLQQIYADVG